MHILNVLMHGGRRNETIMEIKILRNFIAVVQEEGVTAASDVLRISQPACLGRSKTWKKRWVPRCSYEAIVGVRWS